MLNPWRFIQPTHMRWQKRANRELQHLESALAQGIARHMALLNRALREGKTPLVIRHREEMTRFLQAAGAASALLPQVRAAMGSSEARPAQEQSDTYWISSCTLAYAYRFLTQHLPGTNQEPEWMLAVTGLKHGGIRTLDHLIEVKLATQSSGQASFDMQGFTHIAISLHEHGQALHAIFHSHRFHGPPSPSVTDDRLQCILEEGGYPAIQAVFSEDGYVRFFARRRRFAVEVHGKGVTAVDRERLLYRIVQFSTLPHPILATEASGRDDGLRSIPARAGR